MTSVTLVGIALVAAGVGSEMVLRGTKLQTGLARVVLVWALVYGAAMSVLIAGAPLSPVAFTILWGGAFLSWFGVRSHIESSILLRMLVLLRGEPMSEDRIVSEYTARYGEARRLEELCRGGLARRHGDRFAVTDKGTTILTVVEKLR